MELDPVHSVPAGWGLWLLRPAGQQAVGVRLSRLYEMGFFMGMSVATVLVLSVFVFGLCWHIGPVASTRRSCALSGGCPPPKWTPEWNLTRSTVCQPGGGSGYFAPPANKPWGLVSLDWSNAQGLWLKPDRRQSTCEATNTKNCQLMKAQGTATRCFIYHNTELALEWLESQRAAMYDPSKASYFLQYMTKDGKKNGTIYNEPVGQGDQFFWDFTNPQAAQYFVNSILSTALDPAVDGTFIDDVEGVPEEHPNVQRNTGMTDAQIASLVSATQATVDVLIKNLIAAGKYAWQAFGNEDGVTGGPSPSQCINWMRQYCASAMQSKPLMMQMDSSPANMNQTVAAFLIVRPPAAWLGWGWESDTRQWNPISLLQPGTPSGLCVEKTNGVFTRQWSNGIASLDCNNWTARLPFPRLS
eukprot:TRINITY_DN1325_c0_g1_i1.p1 TRINITY_DN1325_c0_g1~~TRINITY_DN1325_c0_g1_i1.p1  ORF type:complete len:414 (+),score=35.17 TRINITY_DN1325_c0_g1_i1:113-1354(+)